MLDLIFDFIGEVFSDLVGETAAEAATEVATDMAIAAAVGGIVYVAYLSIDSLIKKIKERIKEKNLKAVAAQIKECRENNNYTEVSLGLFDDRNNEIDNFITKSERVNTNEIYPGKIIYIN